MRNLRCCPNNTNTVTNSSQNEVKEKLKREVNPIASSELQELKGESAVFEKVASAEVYNLWGKVILRLRDENDFILHAICSGLSNVNIVNDKFIISSDNDAELSTVEENVDKLNEIIKSFGYNLSVEVNHLESPRVINENNIKVLKKAFGDDLIIEQ